MLLMPPCVSFMNLAAAAPAAAAAALCDEVRAPGTIQDNIVIAVVTPC